MKHLSIEKTVQPEIIFKSFKDWLKHIKFHNSFKNKK